MADTRAQLKRQILSLLRTHDDKVFRPKEIAQRLNVQGTEPFKLFQSVLTELDEAGLMQSVKGGRYQHRQNHPLHGAEGALSVHPQGHGFVAVPGHGEFYVPPNRLGTALHGDWVKVSLAADDKNKPSGYHQEAEVLGVVERRRTETVGSFEKMGSFAFVKSDDRRMHKDVYVPEKAFNGAKEGDKVLVSIDTYEDPKAAPEGRVLEVLGGANDPGVAVMAIAMSQGISARFPKPVEQEAERIPLAVPEEEIARRLDLRAKRTFTIDPDDAKDFDDAIHVEKMPGGNLEVGVHIADVSHYVRQGTALDGEAYQRANSTYLVDRVIPMLPEKLSNGVCSLRPREDKLAYSVIMELTPRGAVKAYEIRETVIHSHERFTYDDAQTILDGGSKDHPLREDVLLAGKLGRALTKRRMSQGSIDFDTTEVKVILNDAGEPVDIITKPRREANRLVEEFMLLANKTISEHVAKHKEEDGPPPFVYRIHDDPDPERVTALRDYVRAFGYKLPSAKNGSVTREDLGALLDHVKGTPEEPVVTNAALRTMAKAVYSPNNIGHFGLGFKHYSHFTSPIRRYPDLIAHRLLKHYAKGGERVSAEALKEACDHCSGKERQAAEAERESVKLKQVEYVARHIGDVFDGVVSGVTKFGVFVEMTKLLTEGLVHVRDMDDDYYEYDAQRFTLNGVHTRRTIRLGDSVRVKVAAAQPATRRIDLLFTD